MAGERAGVIQGAFPGGRPRVPVRPPRPGPEGSLQLRPALPAGNATPLPDGLGLARHTPGKRMPQAIQARMESLFGTTFADVRIHEGPEAAAIGAIAFTQGSSIYFAPGQFNPDIPQGQRLLGQQLAHVVQQRAGRVRNPFGSVTAVIHDPLLEAEAEMMGARAAMPSQVQPVRQPGAPAIGGSRPLPPPPILPRRLEAGSLPAQVSPNSARTNWPTTPVPILPQRALLQASASGPIQPGRSVGVPATQAAIQPKFSLAAIVARGRDLVSSVTLFGRRVLGP